MIFWCVVLAYWCLICDARTLFGWVLSWCLIVLFAIDFTCCYNLLCFNCLWVPSVGLFGCDYGGFGFSCDWLVGFWLCLRLLLFVTMLFVLLFIACVFKIFVGVLCLMLYWRWMRCCLVFCCFCYGVVIFCVVLGDCVYSGYAILLAWIVFLCYLFVLL